MNHKQRFMGWRRRMPLRTQYLVDCVIEHIVSEFEKHGFVWYPDFAENNPKEIGANEIPLQLRNGTEWPTVQIRFVPKGPFFQINFSALPERCRDPLNQDINRLRAIAPYGPVYLSLCRGVTKSRQLDSIFGFSRLIRYLTNWRKYLDSEVDAAIALLPFLFETFEQGIPEAWKFREFGQINPNIFLIHSWRIWERPGVFAS